MTEILFKNKYGYKDCVYAKVEKTDGGAWVTIPDMDKRFITDSQIINIKIDNK